MPNPFKAITDYLAGADLKTPAIDRLSQSGQYGGTGSGDAAEVKLFVIEDHRAAMLVHGPGATEALYGASANVGNSAVYACLNAICTAYAEAPVRTYRSTQPGERDLLPDNPLQRLLDRPNPHFSAPELWWWVQWAKHADGNGYLRKIRAGNPESGNVVELWPISPRLIEPFTEKNSPNFIDAYKYQYAPGKYEYISPSNIIHFKIGTDDLDHRKGLSPLKRLVREVCTDDDATAFSDALLKNFAVPGLVVMTTDPDMDEATATALKARIGSAFGSDRRGNVGVLANGAKMEQFGFSPEQLDLKGLHRLPEERIAAVLRVPAIVAGLGAGLEHGTLANFKESREMFVEQTILPLYSFDDEKLNTQLKPDFSSDRTLLVAHDITDMRALQQDENGKWERLDRGVRGGWVSPNEARADVGLPPIEGGDVALPPAGALPLPAAKGRHFNVKAGSFEDFPDLLEAMIELAEPKLTDAMEAYFDRQRRVTKRKLIGGGS